MKGVLWSVVSTIVVVGIALVAFRLLGTSPEPGSAATEAEREDVFRADLRLAEVVAVADEPAGDENLLAAVEGGPREIEPEAGTETGEEGGVKPPLRNEDFVAFLTDTSTPLPERRKAIGDMAQRGGRDAFEALTAAAEARIYLNWAAVRSLGDLEGAGLKNRAAEFLRGKTCDPDMRVACEAIRGCGRLLGEEAVPVVAASIEKNRNRPDGHGDIVAETAVEVLGEIASPEAVPVLTAELQRPEVLEGHLEYGSELVRALSRTGTPEAKKAIAAYAEELEERIPDDRLAGKYYETKIAEARACLNQKESKEVAHD